LSHAQPDGRRSDTEDVSCAERLEFERLLGDLSARFADLPADRVIGEIERALGCLLDFLGFDRCSFGELIGPDGPIEVLCSAARDGFEVTPLGPAPPLPWYFGELQAGRTVVLPNIPADFPPQATAEIEYCERIGLKSNLGIPLRAGGRVIGVIAFTAFRRGRAWPDDLIVRLKIVGEVLAQALVRSRREAELAAALAEITRLKERLEAENDYLRHSAGSGAGTVPSSRSPRFNRVLEEIAQVAPTDATVLLLGETGTGKELLADAIHDLSDRRQRPMVKVNCAALPASLIEAELFGREKGAYTGALARQMGRFELADGSTIFLDEVGELPLELQTKLLRVLQDGRFERVGSTRTIQVNVRELRNLIERAMILARGPTLHVALGPAPTPVAEKTRERIPAKASESTLAARERDHILQVLEQTGWRILGPKGAAERLSIKPTTLESRMKRLGLRRPGSGRS